MIVGISQSESRRNTVFVASCEIFRKRFDEYSLILEFGVSDILHKIFIALNFSFLIIYIVY